MAVRRYQYILLGGEQAGVKFLAQNPNPDHLTRSAPTVKPPSLLYSSTWKENSNLPLAVEALTKYSNIKLGSPLTCKLL